MIIDTHAHLYLPEFDDDRTEALERAVSAGVRQLFLPNVDSRTVESLHKLSEAWPEICFPMMGLHPCSVSGESFDEELDIVKELLDSRNYIAVGEIGLDLYWDKTTLAMQVKALQMQCEWALEKDLPVALHSRNATRECIDVIKPFAARGLKGVFHCFSGTAEEAAEITAMDFFLGIGGVLTFKKSGLDEAIKDISSGFLVLETDAPYLSPVPFRGKRNEPAYITNVLSLLATLRRKSEEEMAAITTANALRLFKKA